MLHLVSSNLPSVDLLTENLTNDKPNSYPPSPSSGWPHHCEICWVFFNFVVRYISITLCSRTFLERVPMNPVQSWLPGAQYIVLHRPCPSVERLNFYCGFCAQGALLHHSILQAWASSCQACQARDMFTLWMPSPTIWPSQYNTDERFDGWMERLDG